MSNPISRHGPAVAALQGIVALLAIGACVLAPPRTGSLLLIPLTPAAAARLPSLVLRGGVRLLGTGPLQGSLVISTTGNPIAETLLAAGVVPLAAPATLCGE